jgi:hypothetical protein
MQAIAKIFALHTLFRRAYASLSSPAFTLVVPGRMPSTFDEADCADCDVDASAFRVTDRLRRWTRVRHFVDAEAAVTHAVGARGVVWEKYIGPTGAINWWSLTEEECEARLALLARADSSPVCTHPG